MKTIVNFLDKTGAKIANMELLLRLSPSGQTIVNEFNLEGNVDKQILVMSKGCKCPEMPDIKSLDKKQQQDDDDWDIVGAELNNGQKIAIKYEKKYYRVKSSESEDLSKNLRPKFSKSEERLNAYIMKLIEQMHRIIVENVDSSV